MGTARAVVVDPLGELLPEAYRLIPYARTLDGASEVTVMVRVDEVTPRPPYRDYTFTLLVVVPTTATGPADDTLDEALEQVLAALDVSELIWTAARRGVLEGTELPCYEITLVTPMTYTTG